MRKEVRKEVGKIVVKQAKTMGTVGSMESNCSITLGKRLFD
jgi:hypothetical protein